MSIQDNTIALREVLELAQSGGGGGSGGGSVETCTVRFVLNASIYLHLYASVENGSVVYKSDSDLKQNSFTIENVPCGSALSFSVTGAMIPAASYSGGATQIATRNGYFWFAAPTESNSTGIVNVYDNG